MNTDWKVGLVVAGIVMLLLGVAAWILLDEQPQPTQADVVAVTIFPLASLTAQIAGEQLEVVQVVESGSSPHDAALTPQQLERLTAARLLLAIGHGLDSSVADRIAEITDLQAVTVDTGIALREFGEVEVDDFEHHADDGHDHDEGLDPHYWLTVPNAITMTETITATLIETWPTHAAEFEANRDALISELEQLEEELQQLATRQPNTSLLTIHDAWSYFATHYGFQLVGTYEPIEGLSPSLDDIAALQKIVEEHGVDRFYTEPQKESVGSAAFLKRELGLDVRTLDPVGGLDNRTTYQSLMRFNMEQIAAQ